MDLLSVIRRWHGRDKLSIREISRRTGLSRHTIRKYLASGITEPKYPPRKSVSKLDPFADKLNPLAMTRRGRIFNDAGIFFVVEGDTPSVLVLRSLATVLGKDAKR